MTKVRINIYHLNEKDYIEKVHKIDRHSIALSNFFQFNSNIRDEMEKFLKKTEEDNLDSGNLGHSLYAESSLFSGLHQFVFENFGTVLYNLAQFLSCDQIFLNNPPERVIQAIKQEKDLFQFHDVPRELMALTKTKMVKLKEDLDNKIIGQTAAKKRFLLSLTKYLYSDETTPLVVAFIGPQGVGKTEMAKMISQSFNPSARLFREQLSMLRNESASRYLLGGDNETDTFSKSLQQRESNVLLLDELNLLAPQLIPAFYQVFDEGIFRDLVYSVDLRKTIIICTANYLNKKEMIDTLGKPFYSRFTAVCQFDQLSREEYIEIANTKINDKVKCLKTEYTDVVNVEDVKKKVLGQQNAFADVRNLDHFIDDAISSLILKSINITFD